jgi:hypothetical protein
MPNMPPVEGRFYVTYDAGLKQFPVYAKGPASVANLFLRLQL